MAAAVLLFASPARANSSSASFTAGGSSSPRSRACRSSRSDSRSSLGASPSSIHNNTNQDVTTEVAFPRPDYELSIDGVPPDLMADFGIGVTTVSTFELKRVDSD